jgi:hypothetical protein
MTDNETIRRLKNVRRRLSHNTEDDMKNDEAMTWAIECVKHVSEYPDYVCSVIDQLLQDIESTCTTYTVDGDTITTDVGYADEGIDFFVKHLKQRLKGKQDDG